MNFLITEDELKNEIRKIEQTFLNKNAAYFEVINYCRKVLESYRKEIHLNGFQDTNSEIQFFKEQKTIPLTYQVYYENLLSIELEISSLGESSRSKFIQKKIQKINTFLTAHKNFLLYIALNQEYLDEIYFTRKYFSKDHIANYNQYERDPLFSSSKEARSSISCRMRISGFISAITLALFSIAKGSMGIFCKAIHPFQSVSSPAFNSFE